MKKYFLAYIIAVCIQLNAYSTPVVLTPRIKDTPVLRTACMELRKGWQGNNDTINISLKGDSSLGEEGYEIGRNGHHIYIKARSDNGLLYGALHLLRLNDAGYSIPSRLRQTPAFPLRMLNHWDNLDGTVERGYAGRSLWKWDQLPDSISPRYAEYARQCAMTGINATVLNNVNASPLILSRLYLEKVKAIADALRPYGLKVFLSINFASPMTLDSLPTADPLDRQVQKWWHDKAAEIYSLIPDFGGFLVKANSEGQPGPMDFGRTHADGANMLARALKPYKGLVMWRAFVYSPADADRAKQAYMEFQPLGGKFEPNVTIQIKNGPVDFQPREPYSPLFGAMTSTPQTVEFQITQEYLGHANHLAFLAPMWEEFFRYVEPSSLSAAAGVANVGDDPNMTGHPLSMANWYAFGRMAWDPSLSADTIAAEWIDANLIDPSVTPQHIRKSLIDMFTDSRETVVDYMMPLGLHHIFAFGHHYGPEPWCDVPGARPDWLPRYYHRADTIGLGFDRSLSGSNAVEQYPEPLRSQLASPDSCPEEFLLWFHHVPWTYTMKSGRTLWEELCHRYARGTAKVASYQNIWNDARPYILPEIWEDVNRRLIIQSRDAQWWKDACLQYFSQYSGIPPTSETYPFHHDLPVMKNINLGIDNYTNPSSDLLDSVR